MEFKHSDIKVLDKILAVSLEEELSGCHVQDVYKLLGFNKLNNDNFTKASLMFQYYTSIISHYNVGLIDDNDTGYSLKKNNNTANFLVNGGFIKKYNELKREKLHIEKNRELTIKKIKQIETNKVISIIGVAIALISLVISIVNFFSKVN